MYFGKSIKEYLGFLLRSRTITGLCSFLLLCLVDCDHLVGEEESTHFSLVCGLCTVCNGLLALSLGVIGRLSSVIVAHPGHHLQLNLVSLNTDGLFTMANSNSFFSPYKILQIAEENKYLGKLFYHEIVLCVLITHTISLLYRRSKGNPYHHLLPDLAA